MPKLSGTRLIFIYISVFKEPVQVRRFPYPLMSQMKNVELISSNSLLTVLRICAVFLAFPHIYENISWLNILHRYKR